jgi:hypothetical protein
MLYLCVFVGQLLCLMVDKEMGERGLRLASNRRCVHLLVRVLTEAYPAPAPQTVLMGTLKSYVDKQLALCVLPHPMLSFLALQTM